MKAILYNNRGSALLISLALMAMLALVALMAVDRSQTDFELSYNQLHEEQAFYVAEAGMQEALVAINADNDWRAGFTRVGFGGGVYSVTLIDSSIDTTLFDTVIIRSTGLVDGGTARVELETAPGVFNPFKYALFGDDWIEFKNSSLVDSYDSDSGTYAATSEFDNGDVGSNGEIDVKNSADLGGDVSTSLDGGLDINAGATVAGDTTSEAPEVILPPISAEEFAAAEATNDNATGMSGSYSYNPVSHALEITNTLTLQSGTYYFSDITTKNNADLVLAPGASVTIYVNGDIELKNSVTVNDGGSPGDCMIYSSGDLYLKNSGDFYGTFYSPEGFADLANSGDIYGSIFAGTMTIHNSAGFHYDKDLDDFEKKDTGKMVVVSWGEIY